MIRLLDHNGTVIHLAYKHTHYTLCGTFRIGGQRGPGMKKVKDLTKAPNCLRCVQLHGRAAKDDVLVTCIPCYAAYTNLTECRP